MNDLDRGKRDIAIMKLVRAGVAPLEIAKRHRLTLNRVNQIIERERCKGTQKKAKARRAKSRAHAAKVK